MALLLKITGVLPDLWELRVSSLVLALLVELPFLADIGRHGTAVLRSR